MNRTFSAVPRPGIERVGRLVLLMALAGLLSAPALRAAENPTPPPSPSRYLPGRTILFVQVGPWSAWSRDWSQTGLAKILHEPELKGFLEGPFAKIRKMLVGAVPANAVPRALAGSTLDFVLKTLQEVAPGPLVVALCAPEGQAPGKGVPEVAFVAGTKGAAKVISAVEMLQSILPIKVFQQKQHQAAHLLTLKSKRFEGTLTVYGGRLILASSPELAEEIIDGIAGTIRQSLSENPSFRACGLTGREHLSAYLDVAALHASLGAGPGAAQGRLKEVLALLGLERMRAIAWSSRMEGPAFTSRAAFLSSGKRTGLLGDLAAEPIAPEALRVCKPGTPFAAGLRVQPGKMWGILRRACQSGRGRGGKHLAAIEQKLAAVKRDLSEEMNAAFGDELILTSYAGTDGAPIGAMSTLVASLSIKNPEKAEKLLVELLTMAAAERTPRPKLEDVLQERTFGGVKTYYLRAAKGSTGMEPKYALAGNRLLVSFDMLTLRSAIKTLQGTNLAGSKGFQTALKGAGGKLGAVFVYLHWGRIYTSAFNFGAQALKLAVWTDLLRGLGIDVNLLPSPEAVTKHLFPSLAVVRTTEKGVLLVSRGPLPSIEVLAPPVAAFSAVLATLGSQFGVRGKAGGEKAGAGAAQEEAPPKAPKHKTGKKKEPRKIGGGVE